MAAQRLFLLCSVVLPFAADRATVAAGDVELKLSVHALSDEVVIGEPILLEAALRNCSENSITEIRADRPHPYQDVEILTSNDGRTFMRYHMGIYPSWKILREQETLAPDEEWTFKLRLLYTFKRPSGLAFERPGDYFVKIRYPLISRSAELRSVVKSNTVKVRISRPRDTDATVWKMISEPEYAYFLQSGIDRAKDRHVPLTLVNVLRTVPKSSYHPAFRWALRKYDDDRAKSLRRQELETNDELKQIREVLGIELKPEGPFPDDRLLDRLVTYQYPKQTPLADVFEEISKKGGVPLELAPLLRVRTMSCIRQTQSLRRFMIPRAAHKAKWVRKGDGYMLVPAD